MGPVKAGVFNLHDYTGDSEQVPALEPSVATQHCVKRKWLERKHRCGKQEPPG